MTNKEKFLNLVSDKVSNTIERTKKRKERRTQLRLSQKISLNILKRIEELGWKQKDLAAKMEVSPQQVSKWVNGRENFTIETLAKLGDVLKFELIEVKPLSNNKMKFKLYPIKQVKVDYEKQHDKVIKLNFLSKKNTESIYHNSYLKEAN